MFVKKGKTNVSSLNMTNIDFTEVEFGFISKEVLRVSFGFGNRSIGEEYKGSLINPNKLLLWYHRINNA